MVRRGVAWECVSTSLSLCVYVYVKKQHNRQKREKEKEIASNRQQHRAECGDKEAKRRGVAVIYCRDSQVETIVFRSQGPLSNGYYTDLLQGHMTEKGAISDVRCVYHYMDFYVGSSTQSFSLYLSP